MLKPFLLSLITLSFLSFMPTSQAYAAASIGRIVHTYGPAWIQRGTTKDKAKKGQVVLRNDAVVTGARGRVKIIMADGSKVYIGAKSRVSLRKYSMRGGQLLNARVNMLWGKARFFVNKLKSRGSSFRVRTPTAVLGVRGTEFIVLVPPTPEILNRAFDNITLEDMPALPTRTILSEGAVDVSVGESGERQRLLPGSTARIGKGGRIVIKGTEKGDDELMGDNPDKGVLDKMGKGAKNGKLDQREALGLHGKPKPPQIRKPLHRPDQQDIRDAIAGDIGDVPDAFVNAIQNLDNTTEIIIKPSFVTPEITTSQ